MPFPRYEGKKKKMKNRGRENREKLYLKKKTILKINNLKLRVKSFLFSHFLTIFIFSHSNKKYVFLVAHFLKCITFGP